jgi:hypothetical protein
LPARFLLKRPKSIEFYRILQNHSPQTRRFHEDPALGRADPARLDEFTGSYQLPGNQGLCSKGPKASNFIEFYKGSSPQTVRFHEDPALGRADPARLDEFTGSYQLPGNQGSCS